MARHRGMAATRRGCTTAYAAGFVATLALALAAPAGAQSSGGATPTEPEAAQPRVSKPPPGVVVRPAPLLRTWRCVRHCVNTTTASTGAVLRLRGRTLGRAYEIVFLGAPGEADDVAAAPLTRTK